MARILIATLADAVEAIPGRKFNVLGGGIDTFQANQFPVGLTRLAVLLALEMNTEQSRQTKIELIFHGTDGKEFMRAEIGLSQQKPEPRTTVVWAGMNLPPINVTAPGRIAITARCGNSTYDFGLEVRGPLAPPPTPGSSLQN